MIEKFTFFWSGPFSQWYKTNFTENEITFNCAEQYMMYIKARIFNDKNMMNLILSTNNPKAQKAYGRQVSNFDEVYWNEIARDIVYKGNYLKFTQNELLLNLLFRTDDTTLVEASPYDKIWGIGLKENNILAQNRETWKGTNWLGETLTLLRNNLRDENDK